MKFASEGHLSLGAGWIRSPAAGVDVLNGGGGDSILIGTSAYDATRSGLRALQAITFKSDHNEGSGLARAKNCRTHFGRASPIRQ
jgi:hypothetical protein